MVIVYDETGQYVVDAVITDHNRSDTIRISHTLESVRSNERVNLLIVHPEVVNEYSGTLRSIIFGSRELALYRQRPRQGREAVRYTVNESAEAVLVTDNSAPVLETIQVNIVNMSTTGVMIVSQYGRFKIGDALEINLNLGGAESLIRARIVRDRFIEDGMVEFGCKLVFE